MRKKNQKRIALLSALAVLSYSFSGFFGMPVTKAAGVTVTLSPTTNNVATNTAVSVTFTPAVAYVNGDTVGVYWNSGYSSASVAVSLAKAGDANFTSATCTPSVSSASCTIVAAGALDTTNPFVVTVGATAADNITTPATAGAYAWSIVTSRNEYGSALQYVGGDNQVVVSANVNPTLSFNIRLWDDSNDTTECDLQTVDTTTTLNVDEANNDVSNAGECGYALAVGTNAIDGYNIRYQAGGPLVSSGTTTHSMTNISDGAYNPGSAEEYGFADMDAPTTGLASGSAYTFDVAYTNVEVGSGDVTGYAVATVDSALSSADGPMTYTAGTDASDTTRVSHALSVTSGTPAGYYTQVVTYTVTANF